MECPRGCAQGAVQPDGRDDPAQAAAGGQRRQRRPHRRRRRSRRGQTQLRPAAGDDHPPAFCASCHPTPLQLHASAGLAAAHSCGGSPLQPVSCAACQLTRSGLLQGTASMRPQERAALQTTVGSLGALTSPLQTEPSTPAHTTHPADVLMWGSRGRPRRPGDRSHPAAARRRARRRRRAARPANAAAGRAGAPAPHLAGRAGRGGRGTGHRRARM